MEEKSFIITAEINKKQYIMKLLYDSSTISFTFYNLHDPNKIIYELRNITLQKLHEMNKIYKQFDSITKVVDVMSSKIEKKNFYFKDGQRQLIFKHKNAYDKEEQIIFSLEKVKNAPTIYPEQRPKIATNTAEPFAPKKEMPKSIVEAKPSSADNAEFFKILDEYIKKKQNLKDSLFDIELRFDDIELKVDVAKNKLFSGYIEEEEKMEALENIKKMCELYLEAKNLNNCERVMDELAKEKNIQFTKEEKERFEDSKQILRKSIPWKLAQTYQSLNHKFRESICNFFVDKYTNCYTPEQIDEVVKLKDKVMKTIE